MPRAVQIFTFEERPSDSPFVDKVWRTWSEPFATFTSVAATHWEMVIMRQRGETSVFVRGPETRATRSPIPEDAEFFGIQFKLGTFMPRMPVGALVDDARLLPHATRRSFWLHSSAWEFPTYDNADTFVNRLMRRVTYQGFADSWPSRPGEFADRINSIPKYVVSSTPSLPLTWQSSTLIPGSGHMVDEISRLRRAPGRDLLVYGGTTMVDTLLQHDLVDEYRLLVFPLVLGSGKRLFNAGHGAKLTLVDTKTRTFSSGAVLLTYTRRQ